MLMLAVLFCIAMCMQACSGPASEDDSSRHTRQRSTAAAASQEEGDDMHDRYDRPLYSASQLGQLVDALMARVASWLLLQLSLLMMWSLLTDSSSLRAAHHVLVVL